MSASAGQIWNWSGEGRFEKNVRTSGKILATSLISPSAFAICVSAVNICIWSFLAWVSMMWIIYKHDDLGYSQELNLPFSSQVHLTMLISILWQPKISSGWQVEVLEQQSSSTHLRLPGFLHWWNRQKPKHATDRTQTRDEERWRQQSHCLAPFRRNMKLAGTLRHV